MQGRLQGGAVAAGPARAGAGKACASLALLLAVFSHSVFPAEAQEARKYMKLAADGSQLVVPPSLTVEPSTSVPLRIAVPSPRDLPPNSFLRLRGLPPAVALSEGYAIAPGVWAVPLASLGNLRVIIPVGVSGRADVTVSLVSVDGAPLAESKLALTIMDQTGAVPRAPQASPTAPQAPAAALSPEARERAVKLVQRGEQELVNGNVAQARAFFIRAAEVGLAHGAIMMGSTYDPGELARLKVQGVQANAAEARKWYEKARELGAPEAAERLAALGRR